MRELSKIFKALSNEKRLEIVKVLLNVKNLSVLEIADKIKLSFRSTSKHLIILEGVGILAQKRKKNNILYSIASNPPMLQKEILEFVEKYL